MPPKPNAKNPATINIAKYTHKFRGGAKESSPVRASLILVDLCVACIIPITMVVVLSITHWPQWLWATSIAVTIMSILPIARIIGLALLEFIAFGDSTVFSGNMLRDLDLASNLIVLAVPCLALAVSGNAFSKHARDLSERYFVIASSQTKVESDHLVIRTKLAAKLLYLFIGGIVVWIWIKFVLFISHQ